MKKEYHYKINNWILGALLILFTITSFAVNVLNMYNLRNIYKETFSERVQLVNSLMASLIDGDGVGRYVELMRGQDSEFKRRQAQYYNDQNELLRLVSQDAPQAEQDAVIARMAAFRSEMESFKSPDYWEISENIKHMKATSKSKYVYIFADTGVVADDGTTLYTYIFDAEDTGEYSSLDSGGLGTADSNEDMIFEVYETKLPMETVHYYNEAPYGELYYTYAPVLDGNGEVVAILGTDLSLGEMNQKISNSILLFTAVFLVFIIIIIFTIFIFVSRSVTSPLVELIGTAQRLASGDTHASVSPAALNQKNELGILAHVINNMGGVYRRMVMDRVIMDSSPFTCVIFDMEQNVIDCNPKALELYGFDDKDSLSKGYQDFLTKYLPEYHWDGRKPVPFSERLQAVRETGYCEFETSFYYSGRFIPLGTVMKLIEYMNKPAIILYQFDLTAVTEARQNLEYRNRLLQALTDASDLFLSSDLASFDATLHDALELIGRTAAVDRVHVWKNRAGEDGNLYMTQLYECYLGDDPQQDNGSAVNISIPYDKVFESWKETLYQGRCLNRFVKDLTAEEQSFLLPKGVVATLLVPIFIHNRLWGFIGFDDCKRERVFVDVEENILGICGYMVMAVDDAIRNEVTMNLIAAKEAALQTSRAKSDFLAKMSHEIRTPMNAIVGITELVLRETISPAVHEHALSIKSASNNLLSIINDILDFSKIESGKLEITTAEYSFTALINDVINIIRVRTMEKQILFMVNLGSTIPAKMTGDEIRIRQILINLLGNAVKYTHEGFISMTIDGELQSDDTVLLRIEISDSGIGIKPEDMDKLFGNFVQVDMSVNKGVQGTGLGLAITKSLCLAMNGDISVSSEYGKGSTFIVSFPQSFDKYEKSASVLEPSEKRVLLYEPREIYANSIARSVEDLGVPCVTVQNEEELYNKLIDSAFSFVFVSYLLFESAKNAINKASVNPALVLLTRYGEIVSEKNVKSLAMPAHTISIANLLNDETDIEGYGDWNLSIGFSAPSARVLIVDDIATNLKVARGLMAPYNMQIDTCMSGEAAIKKAKANRYDLILMDHMMPEMDGIEATRRIRATDTDHSASVPIIALTANVVSGMREMYLKNGFSDYLAKPIEIAKLNIILDKWIPKEKQQIRIPTETEQKADFEISGLNIQKGIMHSGGTENYLDVLAAYSSDGEIRLKKISEYYKAGDIKNLTTYVHALKSASASIGAEEVSHIAEALEFAGINGDMEYIDNNLYLFADKLLVILSNIKSYIKSIEQEPSAPSKQSDYMLLRETLVKLGESLKNVDIEAIEILLEELNTYSWEDTVSSLLAKMKGCISVYDYDDAENVLAELRTYSQNSG